MARDFSRGSDLFDPVLYGDKKIVIVGAGGIGSTTAYTLAKMGCNNITVVDMDTVDKVNCSSQFFGLEQTGLPKVVALQNNIRLLCDEEITAINEPYKPEHIKGADIIIMALDNIETREQIVRDADETSFIIDPRMVKKVAVVNTLHAYSFEKDRWLAEELGHEAPEEVACTSKAVAFNAVSLAGLIGALVSKHLQGGELDDTYELDNENILIHKFK